MSELENLLQSEKQKQMLDTDESLKNNRHLFTIRKKRILKEIFLACFYFFLAATSCITVVCNVLPYDKSGIKSIPYEFIRCAQDDDRIANGFDKTKQIRGQDFDTFVGTCKNLNTLEFPSKINEIANDAY
jgi:hypothetical protein